MREPICHKRSFRRTLVCVLLLCSLALAGCGNKNTQKDGFLQGNQTAGNPGTQGADSQSESGQDTQGTGNQDGQGSSSQSEAGQDAQGTGNQDGQGSSSQSEAGQDAQGTGNQDGQVSSNQGSQSEAGQDTQEGIQGGQSSGSQVGQDAAGQQQGQTGLANQPKIGAKEAKEAALKHAGLSGEEVTFIKEELDYDDGRTEYDIEFVTSTTKYEYEISADDGAVLGSSKEPVEQLSGNTQVQGAISPEEAKEAVLNHAGFTAGQVSFTKVELEMDDGVVEYEIEFYADGKEYSSKVNASTGAIMEYEME